jgi:cell shape-determining protein MreC
LARISNASKSPGIVRGQKGITLEMEYIPRDDEVNNSDVVTTSGAEPGIPPDLVIGTVDSVASKPGDLFQSASIFSPIRVGTLSVVAVLLGT